MLALQASQASLASKAPPKRDAHSARTHPTQPRPARRWRAAAQQRQGGVQGQLAGLWGAKEAQQEAPDLVSDDRERLEAALELGGAAPGASADAGDDDSPAPTDVFADPLPGDSEDVAQLRQLLAGTRLERAPLALAYDADRDGWAADAFHGAVDGRGAALVVALTGAGAEQGIRAEHKGRACYALM